MIVCVCRSHGSAGKGKESEYENLESEAGESDREEQQPRAAAPPALEARGVGPALEARGPPPALEARGPATIEDRDSEQREIDEFEEEERRLLAEEAKVTINGIHLFFLQIRILRKKTESGSNLNLRKKKDSAKL